MKTIKGVLTAVAITFAVAGAFASKSAFFITPVGKKYCRRMRFWRDRPSWLRPQRFIPVTVTIENKHVQAYDATCVAGNELKESYPIVAIIKLFLGNK